jgi:iron complex transport system substrate-binding protein
VKYRLVLIALLCVVNARAEITVTDDAGNHLKLLQPAARIVSLAPHITELLYAGGAGDRTVGAVEYSNFPEAAKALPRIGSYSAFDLERILALKPDLAIAWGSGNPPGQVTQIKRLGIPVFVSEPKRLEDISANLRRLGQVSGRPAEAQAREFEQRLARLRERYREARPISVFYEIWNQPLMTIGGAHVISAVIELCSGRNVFAALDQPAAAVGLEAVLHANPEAIVASGMDESRPEWLDEWRRWPQLRAVKNQNLIFVPPDILQRHTPRILDGAESLCHALDAVRKKGNNHDADRR